MFRLPFVRALVGTWLIAAGVRADSWSYWGSVNPINPFAASVGAQLATDGTNIVYSTYLDGVYRSPLAGANFSALPMTGFPLADAATHASNGLAVASIAATPQGTLIIAGAPVLVTTNSITFNSTVNRTNTLPPFYWFDETNQVWQASVISNKNYPYTFNVGNFSIAPDGSLWSCSGFYPYAYRSLDGGKHFDAFDIDARVPTNYFPLPVIGENSFGEVFSVCAGWNNRVVIGMEGDGYLVTTNNGATWRSVDPDYLSVTSTNPLSRTGDARVLGRDKYGNFLCGNSLIFPSTAQSNWSGVKIIGWHPRDGSVFAATNGFAPSVGLGQIVTTPGGWSFIFQAQNYLLQGGVWRSPNGRDWTQFNQGSGLDSPFAPGLTNTLGPGNCITAWSNTVFIGVNHTIYSFDATPPPVVNHPPAALPQNVNAVNGSPANITLAGVDADGDVLDFSILHFPTAGHLTGTPPDVAYTHTNLTANVDFFTFTVNDGNATSAPVTVNLTFNAPTNTLSTVAITSPAPGSVFIAPANITVTAIAADADGVQQVGFYNGNQNIGFITNAPYATTYSNVSPGDYYFSARALDAKGARTFSAPVRVTVLPAAAKLVISRTEPDTAALVWPLELDGFFLESAPDPSGPWTLWSPAPSYLPGGQTVTMPFADGQFFRLMKP